MTDKVLLNIPFIRNEISKNKLKHWWIANQIDVDRKTISRWLQGKTTLVLYENALNLSIVLKCTIKEVTLKDNTQLFATIEDQLEAAHSIINSEFINKLGPIGEWNVIENLIKATIIPELPLFVLGELYNKMSIACWRQSKLNESKIYAQKAKDISIKINDKTLKLNAMQSLANIASWNGNNSEAISIYKNCLEEKEYLNNNSIGSLLSNLGSVLIEIGRTEEGITYLLDSNKIFKSSGSKMQLSISHCQLALAYFDKKDYLTSKIEIETSIELAIDTEYKRGIHFGSLLLSELNIYLKNDKINSITLLESALKGFAELNIEEGQIYEIAGRICRLLQNYENSKKYLSAGLIIAKKYPLELAQLNLEFGLLTQELNGDNQLIKKYFLSSIRYFEESDAIVKATFVRDILKNDNIF